MAKKKWIVLPGGHIKRWKQSKTEVWGKVPPRWYRNHFNRKERRRIKKAIFYGDAHAFPYVHPGVVSYYW
jgi:hypothetical protein